MGMGVVRLREQADRSLKAARYQIEQHVSQMEAAKKFSTNRTAVSECVLIITSGTAEDIRRAESGEVSLRVVAREVRERVPVAERKEKRPPLTKNKQLAEQVAMESRLWQRVRDAFDAISGLPQPSDVIALIKKNPMRTAQTDKKLIAAFSWITEFSDGWTK